MYVHVHFGNSCDDIACTYTCTCSFTNIQFLSYSIYCTMLLYLMDPSSVNPFTDWPFLMKRKLFRFSRMVMLNCFVLTYTSRK